MGYSLTGAERRVGNGVAVSRGGEMVRGQTKVCGWPRLGNKREDVKYNVNYVIDICNQASVFPSKSTIDQHFSNLGNNNNKKTYSSLTIWIPWSSA
jgi:hypothetical protein